METINSTSPITRRAFFATGGLAIAATGFWWFEVRQPAIAKSAPFVLPKARWTPNDLFYFLNSLPPNSMLTLKIGTELLEKTAKIDRLKGIPEDARDIQARVSWLSSNIMVAWFQDETQLDYHALVQWVAAKVGVDEYRRNNLSTFRLEHELQKYLFAQLWDKLNQAQRKKLLDQVDTYNDIKDKAAIAALGGAGAVAALSATVAFSGFAFYTTMSVVISTVAGLVGVTLPFAAYTGASALVGVLSGPVGWAIMGITALGGLAFAGRANYQKTMAFICQLHALKVEALIAAGTPAKDVFN